MQQNRTPGRPKNNEGATPTIDIILHVAAQLFMQDGFEKVSLNRVAKKCDVTKATVYYYFSSKDNLFTQSISAALTKVYETVTQVLNEEKPLFDRLFLIAQLRFRSHTSLHFDTLITQTEPHLSQSSIEQIREREQKIYQALHKAIQVALHKGEIHVDNPEMAAQAFISLLTVWHGRNSQGIRLYNDPDQAAREIVTLFWNGLGIQS